MEFIMEINTLDDNFINEISKLKDTGIDISARKEISNIKKDARRAIKKDNCFWCGKTCSSFCNSHTVPKFSLKKIAIDGKLLVFNSIIENLLLDIDEGINRSGVFNLICNNCDNTIFQIYEDENILSKAQNEDNDMMLYLIAVKNILYHIYKKSIESFMMHDTSLGEDISNSFSMDIHEYNSEFKSVSKCIKKQEKGKYKIISDIYLQYTVPVAFQGCLALAFDMENCLINDLYYQKEEYRIQICHLAIFPLSGSTRILFFVDRQNKRYNNFIKQVSNLDENEQLKLINYILFLYTEDMFLSPLIDNITLKELKDVAKKNLPMQFGLLGKKNLLAYSRYMLKKDYVLTDYNNIPNLLSEKFSMKKLNGE